MAVSLGSLAVRFGCELHGDPDVCIEKVATLHSAGPGCLSFLANPAYRSQLSGTRAAAVVLRPEDQPSCPTSALLTSDPYVVFARIAGELHPQLALRPGVSPTASIGHECIVPATCEIGAGAVIGDRTRLGDRVLVGPGVVLGSDVSIGADTRLIGSVHVYAGTRIGARCVLHAGAVIGADGFGFARDRDGTYEKVPQVGVVVLGDDVEVGANTTIDRGAIDDTHVGNGVKLDNQVQVGHNVRIGEHTVVAALTGISGSATIGARCIIGGQVGIAGHITIVDDVVIAGRAIVTGPIRKAGAYGGGGLPADDLRRWRRNIVRAGQLEEMAKRLQVLERNIGRVSREES
jgi:UDP-3-O-[3-hydroxymyristoyl] glucosamine N-acyltransferase